MQEICVCVCVCVWQGVVVLSFYNIPRYGLGKSILNKEQLGDSSLLSR